MKQGKLKWLRFDGDGYIEDELGKSYLFDSSTLKLFVSNPFKGMEVFFYTETVLGKEVCVRIEERGALNETNT